MNTIEARSITVIDLFLDIGVSSTTLTGISMLHGCNWSIETNGPRHRQTSPSKVAKHTSHQQPAL